MIARNVTQDQTILALDMYNNGKNIKEISTIIGFSVGKTYYVLRDIGCEFRPSNTPKGFKHTKEFCEMISRTHKGKTISQEQRDAISKANSCNYNGLNGYGHTKKHNRGYVICYVPRHPNAHADGYVMLHTVLMEIHIGRYLNADEVVHHINGIRDDNSIQNLELMNKHDHQSMHLTKRHREGGDLYQHNSNNRKSHAHT